MFGFDIKKTDNSIYSQWMQAKADEAEAIRQRRVLEDEFFAQLGLDTQNEGSKTHHKEGYQVKVTQRHNKKIDAEALQEIANEHGLGDHLSTLFRWKPEINKKVWDAASEEITRPLAEAITVTPGRPSFSITKEEV
jgi:hypothetical protein